MRRPVCLISSMYILGMVIQFWLSLPKLLIYICLGLNIVMFFYTLLKTKESIPFILLMIFFFIGALNLQFSIEQEGELSRFYGEEIQIVGSVREASFKNNLNMVLDVKSIIKDDHRYRVKETVSSSLRGEYYPPEELLGKKIILEGQLEEPDKNRNPKMFNYNRYLKTRKIYSTLYGNMDGLKVYEEKKIFSPRSIANKIRYRMVKNTLEVLPEREGRVLLGILLGDKDELDEEIYQGFREVGAAHILAVSGLHVGIVYLFVERLLKNLPSMVKLIIVFCILFIYIIITGYAPSILRASFMIMLFIIGPLFNRKYDSLCAIFFVAFILLINNPLLLLNTGFQLSFGAVLSLALLYQPILKQLNFMPLYWAQLLSASVAVQLGILPLIAYYFNLISFWSMIINIPIVILLGYILPLGIVTILVGGFSPFFSSLMGEILVIPIRLILIISEWGMKLPLSGYKVVSPSLLFFMTYYSILFILVYKTIKINRMKISGLILMGYFAISLIITMIPQKLEITFLDVGQGDCTVVRTPYNKVILIDGGGRAYGDYDVGDQIVVPYLLRNGIKKVDLVLVSHFHYDHVGGLYGVFKDLAVESVGVGAGTEKNEDYYSLLEICKDQGIPVHRIYGGNIIPLEDNLSLLIKTPFKPITGSRDDGNNNSVVALLEHYNKSVLFTGDIEAEAERAIIGDYPNLKADILKVPHHGSRSSSTNQFLEGIDPEIAVIQVGGNLFGHPHEEVLERLKEIDAHVFRNDRNGAIIVTIDKEKIKVKTMLDR